MKIISRHSVYGTTGNRPNKIIVHAMSEYFNIKGSKLHATEFLDSIKLSAHVLVDGNGDIYRCRNDGEIAWHALGFNYDSLGIEFLVSGTHTYGSFLNKIKTDYVTNEQYDSGVYVVKNWMEAHNIEDVGRHSDYSPERKVDPGNGFKWDQFINNIRST